jgi:hypothetical protein
MPQLSLHSPNSPAKIYVATRWSGKGVVVERFLKLRIALIELDQSDDNEFTMPDEMPGIVFQAIRAVAEDQAND